MGSRLKYMSKLKIVSRNKVRRIGEAKELLTANCKSEGILFNAKIGGVAHATFTPISHLQSEKN